MTAPENEQTAAQTEPVEAADPNTQNQDAVDRAEAAPAPVVDDEQDSDAL